MFVPDTFSLGGTVFELWAHENISNSYETARLRRNLTSANIALSCST